MMLHLSSTEWIPGPNSIYQAPEGCTFNCIAACAGTTENSFNAMLYCGTANGEVLAFDMEQTTTSVSHSPETV